MKNAVDIYITPIGTQVVIPKGVIRGVKFNARGLPDMRYSSGRGYQEWCERQERAAADAWARGVQESYMEAA